MKIQPLSFIALLAIATLQWTGCGAPANGESAASTAATLPPKETTPVAATTQQAPALDPGFAMLTNLEMVEYCLPYPADEYKEDYDAAEEKGQHVLVSKDKRHTITFSGNPTDTELIVLYHDAQGEVQEITMKDPRHDEMGADFFEISWLSDGKIVWIKKWYRKEAMETVTARFEYPAKDSVATEAMIAKVTAATTHCE